MLLWLHHDRARRNEISDIVPYPRLQHLEVAMFPLRGLSVEQVEFVVLHYRERVDELIAQHLDEDIKFPTDAVDSATNIS